MIISIDTLRADHVGCYGYERETSPNIDELSRGAVRFERAFAHSNETAPSHMTLFTGVLPPAHGIIQGGGLALAEDAPFLAELLSSSGYRTAAFADGGHLIDRYGFDRGFDLFESSYERIEQKLERVEAWLAEPSERPFFLFFHTYGVHAPYLPAEQYDVFTDEAYSGPFRTRMEGLRDMAEAGDDDLIMEARALAIFQRGFWGGADAFKFGSEAAAPIPSSESDTRYLMDLYDGCIRQVDAGVGALVAALEEGGHLDDAWLVLTSDHGEAFRDHGTIGHRQLHVEEMSVPLLVRPPGGLPGPLEFSGVVGLWDVAPTLLWALGLDVPSEMRGRCLFPLEELKPKWLYAGREGNMHLEAFVEGGHKLLMVDGEPTGLFELEQDPRELRNLIGEGAEQRVERMAAHANRVEERARLLGLRLGEPERRGAITAEQQLEIEALGYGGGDGER